MANSSPHITFTKTAFADFLTEIARRRLLTPSLGEILNALCEHEVQSVDDAQHDDFVNALLENVNDEWDGDVSQDFIAVQYVQHLEAEVKRLGGSFSPPPTFQR